MNNFRFITLGFEESDIDMCESCNDAVATNRSRGYKVCTDCYVEMGI